MLFQTQILVAKELNSVNHTWLKALSARMKRDEMEYLLHKIETLKPGFDRELADAVLEVTVQANQRLVDELKGDEHMCQALLEIMEPEIMKIKEEVRQETILCAVEGFRDLGTSDDKIREILKKKYGFSDEEADEYL